MTNNKGLLSMGALAACALLIQACDGIASDDPSLHLTGTEEQPLMGGSGGTTPTCSGKKVLVCHIPPGNPANAHTICVGQPAVKAHVSHHGDPLGACDGGSLADAGSPPPVVPVIPVTPVVPAVIDAGPVCKGLDQSCTTSADCCGTMVCAQGENRCYPLIN